MSVCPLQTFIISFWSWQKTFAQIDNSGFQLTETFKNLFLWNYRLNDFVTWLRWCMWGPLPKFLILFQLYKTHGHHGQILVFGWIILSTLKLQAQMMLFSSRKIPNFMRQQWPIRSYLHTRSTLQDPRSLWYKYWNNITQFSIFFSETSKTVVVRFSLT